MRQAPFAFVVELADDAWAHVFSPVIELFFELILDQMPFFLDHHYLFQTFGKLPHAIGFQRPDHPDLVHAQADLVGQGLVDAENFQRLADV